ncbi:unnamed protein product [Gadus morhua 'NCC']
MLELRLWVPPPKKKARGGLASKVDRLAADMEHVRSLLLALLPGTGQGLAGLQPDPPSSQFDDALSLAASANFLNKLDSKQTVSAQASAFYRRYPAPATFTVPPSGEYLKELHACWRDTRAFTHSTF